MISVSADRETLAERAAARVADLAKEAVAARGAFQLVLSGGSTPRALYTRLAAEPLRATIPWARTHLFWGDERAVPPDHPLSNYRMARESLIDHVAVPPAHVHRMRGEEADPARAADDYEREIIRSLGLAPGAWPEFDLVLLGLGPDGHTASLFPGSQALRVRDRLAVNAVAQVEIPNRITLTVPVLAQARALLFLVTGADKAAIVRTVLEPTVGDPDLPARVVAGAARHVEWFLDHDAAARLRTTVR